MKKILFTPITILLILLVLNSVSAWMYIDETLLSASGTNTSIKFDILTNISSYQTDTNWINITDLHLTRYISKDGTIIHSPNSTWLDLELNDGSYYRVYDFPNATGNDFTNHTIYYNDNITMEFNLTSSSTLIHFNVSIDGSVKDYNTSIGLAAFEHTFTEITTNLTIGTHHMVLRYNDNDSAVVTNYTFYVTNITNSYNSTIIVSQTQEVISNINYTDGIESINVTIIYNGTAQTDTETNYTGYEESRAQFVTPSVINGDFNATIIINYHIVGLVNNITGSFTYNQTIAGINIDNCSVYGTKSLQFDLYNETDDSATVGSMSAYFRVWMDDPDAYTEYNLTWGDANSFGVCISQANETFYALAQVLYSGTGFLTETYYFTNVTLDNTTQIVNLYLTEETTLVSFTVTDENDNPVENVYIYVMSYDVDTDSAVTTEIIKTGFDGVAVGHIVLDTQYYQFMLYYEGDLVEETSPVILTGTAYSFQIALTTDYFDTYSTARSVSGQVTYSNATNIFTFTYSDASGSASRGCLEIVRSSVSAETQLDYSCTSSAAATLTYNIGAPGAFTYIGTGTVYIDDEVFVLDEESFTNDRMFDTIGIEGLFWSFLILITLVMVGTMVSPVAAVMFMIVGVLMLGISKLGLFHLSLPTMLGFVIVGGIVLYKVSRK